jgi:hypothetical protein
MDLDGESYVEPGEPDSTTAAKAMRFVKQTYGTNHFLTKSAYQEVLRIQALGEAKAHDVPIHIAMGRWVHKLAKLEKKLGRQADFMQQAKEEFEQAEKRMADLATTTADIEADIRASEAEHDDLHANIIPMEKKLLEAGSAGISALNLFFEGANGVVDPAILLKLRDEIAAIARQIQPGTPAFTPLSAASEATEASPALSGATTPSGPQDNSGGTGKGVNQAWAKQKRSSQPNTTAPPNSFNKPNPQAYSQNRPTQKPPQFGRPQAAMAPDLRRQYRHQPNLQQHQLQKNWKPTELKPQRGRHSICTKTSKGALREHSHTTNNKPHKTTYTR